MTVKILVGDCVERLREVPDGSVHCIVTSPPYYSLRDYGIEGQFGAEKSPAEYVARLCDALDAAGKKLRPEGTLWLNLGDSMSGSGGAGEWGTRANGGVAVPRRGENPNRNVEGLPRKNLIGIPWMVAFELQQRGWWLRSEIVWHKPNPTTDSAQDRPVRSHEKIFLFSKSVHYYYDRHALKDPASPKTHARIARRVANRAPTPKAKQAQPGVKNNPSMDAAVVHHVEDRFMRDIWTMPVSKFTGDHFAGFPEELPRKCILLGTSEKGCCAECGAPIVRHTERVKKLRDGSDASTIGAIRSDNRTAPGRGQGVGHDEIVVVYETIGWYPSCDCLGLPPMPRVPRKKEDESKDDYQERRKTIQDRRAELIASAPEYSTVPPVVLDQFFGAGTTGLVAGRLGRDCIGIELSPKYAGIAQKRIKDDAPLLNFVEVVR